MNSVFVKAARAVAGVIVLFLVVAVVSTWWGDYRDKTANGSGSKSATSTAEPGKEEPKNGEGTKPGASKPKPKTIIVLTDGLNFRERPSQGANAIRGLDKGEKLTLIKKEGDWYNVQDAKGIKGWISASPTYTKIQ